MSERVELSSADDQSFCLQCPENSVSPEASRSFDDCVCASGFYADTRMLPLLQGMRDANLTKTEAFRLNASKYCRNCISGTACIADGEETAEGLTLETLPLLPGYWRNSPQSLE